MIDAALAQLRAAAVDGDNIMPSSIDCARAGVTTGEWSQVLRDVFGEYRAPTGIDISRPARCVQRLERVREQVRKRARNSGAHCAC